MGGGGEEVGADEVEDVVRVRGRGSHWTGEQGRGSWIAVVV